MTKFFAIVAGEPSSINSEIIVKAWKKINNKKKFFIIGNYMLLKKQINKIGLKIKVVKITSTDEIKFQNKLNILNVDFKFKSLFDNQLIDTRRYVLKSLDIAHDLVSKKKNRRFY